MDVKYSFGYVAIERNINYEENVSHKRKETDDKEFDLVESKSKIVKMVQDMAGEVHSVDSKNGQRYSFRITKLSDMVTSLSSKTFESLQEKEPRES